MRIFRYLIILFFCPLCVVNAQWDRALELPIMDTVNSYYNDFHFFNNNEGILLSGRSTQNPNTLWGYILNTSDGGESCDTIAILQDTLVSAIDFPTAQVGYIAIEIPQQSELAVLKTNDGGQNWQYQGLITNGSPLAIDLQFYTEDIGVFSGQGYSAITYDGGVTWSQIVSNPHGGSQFSLIKDSIYAGTHGQILFYSNDTCQNFIVDTINWGGSANGITYGDDIFYITVSGTNGQSYGYPFFNFGIIAQYHIDNELININHFPQQRPRTIVRTENNDLYAGTYDTQGFDKRFLKSVDGGQTWYSQQVNEASSPTFSIIEQVYCVNDTVCFASSANILYKTTNGGGPLIEQVGFAYSSVEENPSLENTLLIYPNPVQDILNITTDEKIEQVQVVNLSGKILLTVAEGNTAIDVGHLKSGVYLVKIQTAKNSFIRKFEKE